MPRVGADAEVVQRDPAYVADEHKPGVLAIERMRAAGIFERVEEWFPIVRPRGHGVVSLFAAATLFLSAGPDGGIRPFFERMYRRTRRRLGALAGVRSLPTAGSISRAVTRFEHVQVRPFVSSLLASSIDKELLSHPAVHHHDALGEGWHTVDLDPTIKGIRRRDLPEGDDLPAGKRRAKGEPGYVGRKRGEARMRMIPVIHDGAGLWLSMVLVAEEGSIVPYCRTLMQSAMESIAEHGDADRVIARGDGELGSAGAIRAIIDSGAHPLVRLSRYQLLDREQVASHLRQVSWCLTRPGESGLQREAAELGTFTLQGVTDSEDEAVVTVRVIVTRFPRTSEPDHGVMRDGYQLELFATTLDPLRWPAPDVIELYGGRATIENRFAQEDREFNLERAFTFHPAGQEWLCGMGLFLWNEQVRAGWLANPPPAERPVQVPRPPLETLRRPPLGDVQACLDEIQEVETATEIEAEAEAPPVGDPVEVECSGQPPETAKGEPADSEGCQPPVSVDVEQARARLSEVVGRVFVGITTWPGWRIESGQLRCPEGRRLIPYSALGTSKAGGPRLAVRTEPWACNGCPIRATCFSGRGAYKQIVRTLDEADLEIAAQALATLRSRPAPRPMKRHRVQKSSEPTTPSAVGREHPVFAAPEADVAGPLYFEGPRFLPAAARRLIRDYARGIDIILRVGSPKQRRPPPPHPLLATSAADRAHRRLTMRQVRARERVELHTRLLTSIRARFPGSSATT